MKKRKLIRNVSLVALSAVMVCGTAVAFAGCGKDTTYSLSVNIFCNDSDAATNREICNNWAARYSEQLHQSGDLPADQEITVNFDYNSVQETYFQALQRDYSGGNAADIIYLSPKYVKSWVSLGRVMDISEFISSDEDIANVNGIWEDSLGLYGYAGDTDGNLAQGYMMGDRISYLKAGETPSGSTTAVTEPGFYTTTGIKTGLYGLPKDYSNFGMAYNAKYFSKELKEQLQKQKATTTREVKGARGNTAKLTFKGEDEGVITYAVDGDGYSAGDDAPIINIGIPTTYKPYNFYRFANYADALAGGDPMALAVEIYTNGEGYTVTIPGFPGDTFDIDDATLTAEEKAAAKNKTKTYDSSIGHITYTYQEFGALTWALTYYYNTFNWNCKNADGDAQAFSEAATLSGTGGIKLESGTMCNVYGNDQYEGAPGPTLYLLPWLYGNDVDFINQNATRAISGTNRAAATDMTTLNTIEKMRAEYNKAQTETEKRTRIKLDGSTEQRDIEYGVNSDRFVETYGAFIEYGSTWNGNCGNCGDENTTKSDNGWAFFRGGAELFYGSGTWDSATRNQSDYRDEPAGLCEFRMMPQAISEKYALYSTYKDAFYEMEEAGEKKAYTIGEVYANQVERQNKWGARMDSVGFAANASLAKTKGTSEEWKIAGAASLIMALCINEDAQVTLTYSGAQLPNFKEQCVDFLHYQETEYANGTFKDMLTPEGSATVTGEAGRNLWNAYYDIVWDIDQASRNIGDFKGQSSMTVGDWIAQYHPTVTANGKTEPTKYNEAYKDVKLSSFTGEISNRGFAMKIFNMVTFTYADRDLNLRMQYGLNSARDSAMYTYNVEWINLIQMRDGSCLAYNLATPITKQGSDEPIDRLEKLVITTPDKTRPTGGYQTAAVFCLKTAGDVQAKLEQAIQLEANAIKNK